MNERTPIHTDDHRPDVPLKEYIERILDEREKAMEAARQSMEIRLDRLNELRQEVQEDRSQYLTRDRYDSQHQMLEDKVNSLEAFRGKALGFGALLSLISAVVGAIIVRSFGG